MSSEIDKFSVELVKIAAQDSERRPKTYVSSALAVAPLAIAKGLLDVPKGMLDKAVDSTIRTGKSPAFKSIMRRGVARGAGAIAPAVLTTPVFLKGLKQLSTAQTEKDRNRGMANVLGAGFTYAALKGATETFIEKRKSLKPKDFGRVIRNVAGVRGAVGLGSAALTGYGIARGRSKEDKPSLLQDAALGTVVGAGKGALDELAEKGVKSLKTSKGIRGIAARAGGRAAAGAIGAVALGKIFDSYMKKTSSVASPLGMAAQNPTDSYPTPTPAAVYDQITAQAKSMPASSVYSAYAAHVARGAPEANPMRRAVHYALSDSLEEKGHRVPPPKMRNKVTPKSADPALPLAAMAGVLAAPPVIMKIMDSIPPTEKDALLSEALDSQILSKNIDYIKETPDAIWGEALQEQYKKHIKSPHDAVYLVNRETGKKTIMVGPKTDVAYKAHELGHATASPLRQSLLQTNLVSKAHQLGRVGSIVIPMGAVFLAADDSFATPRELDAKKKLIESVGSMGAVLMAPKLVEEGLASAKGAYYLAKAEAATGPLKGAIGKALSRAASRLGPAFLTYASPLLIPGIAARYLGRRADKAEKDLYEKVRNG